LIACKPDEGLLFLIQISNKSNKSKQMKTTLKKPVAIVGYSGHAYVIIDILLSSGRLVTAYCDNEEKEFNPYHLTYLGKESDVIKQLKKYDFFACVAHNGIREKIHTNLGQLLGNPINAIHPSAVISGSVKMGDGIMIAANATLNPLVQLGRGVICNTSTSIDHECIIGDFSHIAPGAVLCGNVTVGKGTFIGANSVIRQGINIGNNVIIGAGTVVVKDVADNATIIGNPARSLVKKPSRKLIAA
jgi:sugar O-acyltransferase (sialic acid O-acetyltransferase NeuD family)